VRAKEGLFLRLHSTQKPRPGLFSSMSFTGVEKTIPVHHTPSNYGTASDQALQQVQRNARALLPPPLLMQQHQLVKQATAPPEALQPFNLY
jgi:hypothetical protein